jgi:hypothetical protein
MMNGKKRQLFAYTSFLLFIGAILVFYLKANGVVAFVGIERNEIP